MSAIREEETPALFVRITSIHGSSVEEHFVNMSRVIRMGAVRKDKAIGEVYEARSWMHVDEGGYQPLQLWLTEPLDEIVERMVAVSVANPVHKS